ncbi:MAG: cell division protein FtsL [Hyphomicrobiaceae bacterium]
MRRVVTSVVWALTILSVFALYAIKYDTRQLEVRVRGLERMVDRTTGEIAVLQAEWGHLTQPDRIERLARRHLGYGPILPDQFATLDEVILASRLAKQALPR